jgi:molybdopterin molybdotransferase
MIQVYEATQILADGTSPLGVEDVGLAEAHGRVLAQSVHADREFPPADRSAMDGFAVRATDLPGGKRVLKVVAELPTGSPAEGIRVGPGEAVRIFTGAVLPAGADAVVIVERTRENSAEGSVEIDAAPSAGDHVRRAGSEMARGAQVLDAGTPIHAPEIAALAAVGLTRVRVHIRPSIKVLATGNELTPPGQVPQAHQSRNSNSGTLLAQLAEMGLRGEDLGVARDDLPELGGLLRRGLDGDLLLITGGVSVGKYDLVGRALEQAGMELLFHKVAVKPGKPILVGRCGRCLVVGLPGNPVSAYTGFAIFVAPALRRMLGYRRWSNLHVRADVAWSPEQEPGRTTYHLARVEYAGGRFVAQHAGSKGSGDLLSMTRANGFVVTPPAGEALKQGESLPALLWRDFQFR